MLVGEEVGFYADLLTCWFMYNETEETGDARAYISVLLVHLEML